MHRQKLGRVFHPRAVVRFQGSEVEPDLMVREWSESPVGWDEAPVLLLVVEVLSDVSRRRDPGPKREFYLDAGIAHYWIVDGGSRTIRAIQRAGADIIATDVLTWLPYGASEPLVLNVQAVFREALGD